MIERSMRISVGDRKNRVVRAEEETFRVEPGLRSILSALRTVRGHALRVSEEVIVRTFENCKSRAYVAVPSEVSEPGKVSTRRALGRGRSAGWIRGDRTDPGGRI
jgi:hypothetical protein